MLAIHCARIGHQDRHRHFFRLHFVLRQLELEHLALVAEVNFFLFGLVGKRDAGDEWPSWLGLNVEEKVAFGIKTNVFLPCVVIRVKRVDEEDLIPDLFVASEAKVEVYLFVVFPYLPLLVWFLQLVVSLLRLLFVFLALRC